MRCQQRCKNNEHKPCSVGQIVVRVLDAGGTEDVGKCLHQASGDYNDTIQFTMVDGLDEVTQSCPEEEN